MALAGCAGPKPILNPNEHLRAVGEEQADRDIAECQELAGQAGVPAGLGTAERAAGRTVAGSASSGAVGGAVLGRPGTSGAFGTATGPTTDLTRSTFRGESETSQAYRDVVDRCLRERGYEPAGWE